MRVILNIIWLDLRRSVARAGLSAGRSHLLSADRHHPFGFASAHRAVRAVAVRPDGHRQACPQTGATIGNVIWLVLCGIWLAIGHHHRDRYGSDHRRHSTGAGEPQSWIPVSLMPRQEIVPVDRARDWTAAPRRDGHDPHRPRPAGRSAAATNPGGHAASGPLLDTPRPRSHRPAGLPHRPLQSALPGCMPAEGLARLPADDVLTFDELPPGCCGSRSPGWASPVSGSPAASRCSTAGWRTSWPPQACNPARRSRHHQRRPAPRAHGLAAAGLTG